MAKEYLSLDKLETYKLSRKLSVLAWKVYESFDWRIKKIIGDQFVTSVDSTGANIAEGYGRFHYLDKVKFYSPSPKTSELALRMKAQEEPLTKL